MIELPLPDPILVRLRLALLLHQAAAGASRPGPLRDLVADTLNNRGVRSQQIEALEAALAHLDHALSVAPDHAEALNNRGAVLTELGRPQQALEDLARALAQRPGNPNAMSNRGNALSQLGQFAAALRCYDQALAIKADHLDARLNRGVVRHNLRRFDDALADFAVVLGRRPGHPGARYNASLAHLAKGDYAAGWALHEARWELPALRGDRQDFPQPPWRGEADVAGKTVLLWAEQGLGDTLQFCRYATLLAQRAKVILLVPRTLVRLLTTLPGVARVVTVGDRRPDFDLHCPLLSLPRAFGTLLGTIPAAIPYLHAAPDQVARWDARLADLPGLRVGLAWAGNPRPANAAVRGIDARRSMALAQFAPLGGMPGISLVSLQKGDGAAQAPPPGMVLHDWTGELDDFADTAALVSALDLVITVDTAMAHLAGALGKPVWVLNRFDTCWRWLGGRTDSLWYPTARLVTQSTPGDWAGVVGEIAAALRVTVGAAGELGRRADPITLALGANAP